MRDLIESIEFLFQTGSIKSDGRMASREKPPRSFYSKLVRLKGQEGVQGDTRIFGFYSKLVRLKGN